jgi:cysteine desulfurase
VTTNPNSDARRQEIYLDHAATTTPRPGAIAAMQEVFSSTHANASGQHAAARRAKNALEEARERAAELIGAQRPHDIVFTSGGTESDNLAISGTGLASQRRTVVVSGIEHKAVIESAKSLERFGYSVQLAPADTNGVVTPEAVAWHVDSDTALVSVMAANNEVGTVEPIADIVNRVRSLDASIPIHTDAVQYFVGRSLDVASLGVSMASLSAHKFGGPTGVGLLYVAPGTRLEPVVVGGSQEAGRRPGTSNVAGIVGMVSAMETTVKERDSFIEIVQAERDAFERRLFQGDAGITFTAADADRLPHFSHVRIPGVLAETLLIRLDAAHMFAAAGSACQSGAVEPSHVLTAMGMKASAAAECVRFTFGWDTEPGTGDRAAELVLETVGGLR